jgi:hypothetical protein
LADESRGGDYRVSIHFSEFQCNYESPVDSGLAAGMKRTTLVLAGREARLFNRVYCPPTEKPQKNEIPANRCQITDIKGDL